MLYRNKNIRALYKVPFVLMIGGIIMAVAGSVVLAIGLVSANDSGFHLVVGGILAVAGIVMAIVNAITIYISRKFDSVSEITAV